MTERHFQSEIDRSGRMWRETQLTSFDTLLLCGSVCVSVNKVETQLAW